MGNISLRYFNVFGPKQESSEYATVIPRFIKAVLLGRRPEIFGSGEQIRDFVFVNDVAKANCLAWQHDSIGTYNIASGKCYSINEILKNISKILDGKIEPIYSPPRVGDSMGWMVDISKASKIGFKPEYDIDRGLRSTIEWYQNVGYSN
jgi:UDP-glucose 4-epimerase